MPLSICKAQHPYRPVMCTENEDHDGEHYGTIRNPHGVSDSYWWPNVSSSGDDILSPLAASNRRGDDLMEQLVAMTRERDDLRAEVRWGRKVILALAENGGCQC